MARSPSFWPQEKRAAFDTHLYDKLSQGQYAQLQRMVLLGLRSRGYEVPNELDGFLLDGLLDGFRAGILNIQGEPAETPGRFNELGERYQAAYRQMYQALYPLGVEDAIFVRGNVHFVGLGRRLEVHLAAIYRTKQVPRTRAGGIDDVVQISLQDKRVREIINLLMHLLDDLR